MHRFQLVTANGHRLGTVDLSRPDWPEGSVIYGWTGRNLRVVAHEPTGSGELAVLVVEPSSSRGGGPKPDAPQAS